MNLTDLTLKQCLTKLRSREITAVELTTAYLDRIEKLNPELNAYITITRERALADAAESDARYAAGNPRPLEGIPIGMKDLFATKGIRTTAGSAMLENFVPQYESTVSENLANAGCVLLGKTNMDEFAMAGDGTTSHFDATVNPHKLSEHLTPGGSSSGSAAAVAAGMCAAATGSDTGDSIRRPASFTGIVGMKPTYGLCSRYGVVAYSSSLDHPGAMARNVADTALLLSAMAGTDPRDSTSSPRADAVAAELAKPLDALPLSGIKLGVISEIADAALPEYLTKIWNKRIADLESAGAEIVRVSIPHIMHTGTLYAIISRAEASSNLARFDGVRYGLRADAENLDDMYKKTRAAGFGDNVKFRLFTGAVMLTRDFYNDCFLAAARVRQMLDDEFVAAFNDCDFIITLAATDVAHKIGNKISDAESKLSNAMLVGANMSGLPACAVPAGMARDLPVGMQIIGRRFDDVRVLQMAQHIETLSAIDNKPTTIMGE